MSATPPAAGASTPATPENEVSRRARLLEQAATATNHRLSGLFRVEKLTSEPPDAVPHIESSPNDISDN